MDYIFDKKIKINQSSRYKMTSDTNHLAHFMEIRKSDKVLDIGTNNGALALVAALFTQKQVIGIDIEDEAIACAQSNASLNQLNHCHFEKCKVQDFSESNFNVILCNPPYHIAYLNKADVKQFDEELNLKDLALHSYRLLKDQGRLYLVIKAYRVAECIELFKQHRFALRRIQSIHHSLDHQASSVCLEFRKEGKDHCIVCPPIINQKRN